MKNILLVAAIAVVTGCSDAITTEYSTYAEAKDDKLFERGWLPDILPKSTTNIEVKNDLDRNTSVGSFFIEQREIRKFLDKVEQTERPNEYRLIEDNNQWFFTVDHDGFVRFRLE